MKWLRVESHFTTRLSRYAWISYTSLIYGMTLASFFFIWMNLKISILFIQERCYANCSLKLFAISFLLIPLMLKTSVLHQASYKVRSKHTAYLQNKVHSTVEYWRRESFFTTLRSSHPEVFFKKRCSENLQQIYSKFAANLQQIYRKAHMSKCDFN